MLNGFMRYTLLFQGFYYLIISVWPLIHIDSFLIITGYKQDVWLVKMVSVIILCISLTILYALSLKEKNIPVFFLSFISPVGFLFVELYYVNNNTIKEIYLVDALLELQIILVWLVKIFRDFKLSMKIFLPVFFLF
jgi:hypothetical protein